MTNSNDEDDERPNREVRIDRERIRADAVRRARSLPPRGCLCGRRLGVGFDALRGSTAVAISSAANTATAAKPCDLTCK